MQSEKRPRGRPKKTEGLIKFWHFVRAGMLMSAFDEARESGEKHSAAVTQAGEDVRQRHPEMPVSETEVRRTLAMYRPRTSRTILRFQRSILDDEKLVRLRSMLMQVAKAKGAKNLSVPPPSIKNLSKNLKAFTFGYFERPLYPRHNRKIPND
jgi:hypothetical protein